MHSSLYVVNVVNAYLIDEILCETLETIENKKAHLRKDAKFIAALFSRTQQNAHCPGLEDMIAALDNFLLSFLFTFCKFVSNYIYNL